MLIFRMFFIGKLYKYKLGTTHLSLSTHVIDTRYNYYQSFSKVMILRITLAKSNID